MHGYFHVVSLQIYLSTYARECFSHIRPIGREEEDKVKNKFVGGLVYAGCVFILIVLALLIGTVSAGYGLTDAAQPVLTLRVFFPYIAKSPPPEPNLFFDMNGSGLHDTGEPGLAGFTICVEGTGNCTTTNIYGRFTLAANPGDTVTLLITDPNAHNPSLAMRYINKWNGAVVISAYEMNGVAVPEQHLNDAEVVAIREGIEVVVGDDLQVGLMQGFLGKPHNENLPNTPFITTYTDLDLNLGTMLDWTGNTTQTTIIHDHDVWNAVTPGLMNQHQGTDWAMEVGTQIIAMAPGRIIISDGGQGRGFARYVRQVVDIPGDPNIYLLTYGHNSQNLVVVGPTVYERGHVLALSGRNGSSGEDTTNPHLHVSVWQLPRDIWEQYQNEPELYDYLFGRGAFEGNGRSVTYPNGKNVALDYCPFGNRLFIRGSNPD